MPAASRALPAEAFASAISSSENSAPSEFPSAPFASRYSAAWTEGSKFSVNIISMNAGAGYSPAFSSSAKALDFFSEAARNPRTRRSTFSGDSPAFTHSKIFFFKKYSSRHFLPKSKASFRSFTRAAYFPDFAGRAARAASANAPDISSISASEKISAELSSLKSPSHLVASLRCARFPIHVLSAVSKNLSTAPAAGP